MLKNIIINLEAIESMLYYWSAVADKEKVSETFFIDFANSKPMNMIQREDFNEESIRKVLSSIQNRELLSQATKPEKRFWSKNMWMAEDLSLSRKMAEPFKKLNLDSELDDINKNIPNLPFEEINIYIAPLHLDTYYIVENNIIINYFMLYFDEGDNPLFDGKNLREYLLERISELK